MLLIVKQRVKKFPGELGVKHTLLKNQVGSRVIFTYNFGQIGVGVQLVAEKYNFQGLLNS